MTFDAQETTVNDRPHVLLTVPDWAYLVLAVLLGAGFGALAAMVWATV